MRPGELGSPGDFVVLLSSTVQLVSAVPREMLR